MTKTLSSLFLFLEVKVKCLWSPVDWWQGTEYEYVLVWNLHRRAGAPGAGEPSWPPAALTRRIVNRFGSNELWLLIGWESYNGPLIGWWFPIRAPSLWSSLQLVAQAAKLHPLCRKQLEAKKLRWQLNVRCCANKSFKQIQTKGSDE